MKTSEIIKNVELEKKCFDISDTSVLLYHGSKSGINGRIAPISRDKCDFGKGL